MATALEKLPTHSTDKLRNWRECYEYMLIEDAKREINDAATRAVQLALFHVNVELARRPEVVADPPIECHTTDLRAFFGMNHTMSGPEIRNFTYYLRLCASYELQQLKRDNVEWDRDAAVALVENEAHRRGVILQ